MFQRIIELALANKVLVLLSVSALALFGIYSAGQIPLDAVPDITNNQVQVVTSSPSLAPQEVEEFITYPLELSLANLPGAVELRSISRYGLSVITIVFEEDIPILKARQYVKEKVDESSKLIPPEIGVPELMPITSGLGEIYQYVLEVQPEYRNSYDAMRLRDIQDWLVKRQLSGVKGIVEVSSFGGFLRQYEVSIDPVLLESFDIELKQIHESLQLNNANAGGSYVERGPNAIYIRSEGLMRTKEDIENTIVENRGGTPILIRDIAKVKDGFAPRYGAMTMDGKGEVVGGITLMLKGANSSKTIENVQQRIQKIQKSLPEGIDIYPYLDRSKLVNRTIGTVSNNLLEGGLIVIFVLILLLGNWRSGLIVASVIPLSLLFALILMRLNGTSANLMSMGAIDFGIVVDGAVIIVESILHSLYSGRYKGKISRAELDKIIGSSSGQLAKSASFGVLIILVVFIPVLSLEGIEGKMFRPMAQTVSFAILGALILAITYVPVMSSLVLKRNIELKKSFSDRIIDKLRDLYEPALSLALKHPIKVVITSVLLLFLAVFSFLRMGAEFIPTLEEGDLAMQMSIKPGSSLTQSVETTTKVERILLENFPEVRHVVSKIGTAEVPTDPMAMEDADIMIILKERDDWVSADDREELVEKMKLSLEKLLGANFEFTQPIQLRFNELITGSKSDISLKIFGDELQVLSDLGERATALIEPIRGAADVKLERTQGFPQMSLKVNRQKAAEYGVDIDDINRLVRTAYAGEYAGVIYESERRYDLVLRYEPEFRKELDLDKVFLLTNAGNKVHLSELVDKKFEKAAMQISREQTRRRISVGINVRERDAASLVEEIQNELDKNLKLPPGYYLEYGGQFENLESAQSRLAIAVPIALALIIILLYMAFGSIKSALIVFSGVPLSAIGGVAALYMRGMPFSISAGIGFIALFGVAVLNGIVLMNHMLTMEKNEKLSAVQLAIKAGLDRLRPVIMTASVAALGFLPMALSTSAGAEVQKPLATVVIGGLISSTVLTLFVLPVLFYLSRRSIGLKPKVLVLLPLLFLASAGLKAQGYPEGLSKFISQVESRNLDLEDIQLEQDRSRAMRKSAITVPKTAFVYQYGQINSSFMDYNWQLTQNLGVIPQHLQRSRQYRLEESYYSSVQELRKAELKREAAAHYLEYWKNRDVLFMLESLLEEFEAFGERNKLREKLGEISGVQRRYAEDFYRELVQIKLILGSAQRTLEAEMLKLCFCDSLPQLPGEQIDILNIEDSGDRLNNILTEPLTRDLEIRQQQLSLQRANYFPELELGYFNQQLDGVRGFDGLVFGLQVPLFIPNQKSKVSQAKIDLEIANNQKDRSLNEYERDLKMISEQLALYTKVLENDAYFMERSTLLESSSNKAFSEGEIEMWEHLSNLKQSLELKMDHLDHLCKYNQLLVNQKFYQP